GLGDAHGVVVTDPVPSGVSFVSARASQGSCDAAVTCSLGDLGASKKATVTITVSPTSNGPLSDTASTSSSVPDGDPSDNSARSSTTVQATNASADLSIAVSDSPDPVPAGMAVSYALKVSNAGPSTATGVTITNPVPPGTAFVSASPSTSCAVGGGVVT